MVNNVFRERTTFIINDDSKSDSKNDLRDRKDPDRASKVMQYVNSSKSPKKEDLIPIYFGCQTCQQNTRNLQRNLHYLSVKRMAEEKKCLKTTSDVESSVDRNQWNHYAPHQIENYPTHPTNFKKKPDGNQTVSESKNLSNYNSFGNFFAAKS
jgi:hypothetical protein